MLLEYFIYSPMYINLLILNNTYSQTEYEIYLAVNIIPYKHTSRMFYLRDEH